MTLLHITAENFKSEVEQSKVPVVIDFYADWCGPCRMMAPVFEELSSDYNGKVKFVKVDTENASDIASNFDVMSIPTLVVMNKGKEIGRTIGFVPKAALKQKIDSIISDKK